MTHYISIQRSTTIPATAAQISEKIIDFRKWREWSPWEELDPNLQRTFSGSESGVGAVYEWRGNKKAGTGRMEITSVAPDKITSDLTFIKPFKSEAKIVFEFQESNGSTTLNWTVSNPKTLGMRIFNLFVNMDKAVGKDLEKGLDKLKQLFAS